MLILSWKVPDYVLRCFNRVEGDNSSSSFNSLIFVWHGTTVMRVSFTKHDWKINISTLNRVIIISLLTQLLEIHEHLLIDYLSLSDQQIEQTWSNQPVSFFEKVFE